MWISKFKSIGQFQIGHINQIKWECNSLTLEKFPNVLLAKFQINNEISKVWPVSVSLMGKNARIPGQATEHKLKRGRRKLLKSGYAQHSWILQSPWWAEDFLMDYSLKKLQFHSACPAGGNKLKKFKHLWTLKPHLFWE